MLICLIVLIGSMAGVSAEDNSNQTITENANSLVGSVDTLGVSLSDDDVVGSADNGTFTDLQNKIDDADEGSTITLENDYRYDDSVEWSPISISKSLTIDGNGYTIDGMNHVKIFNIENADVVLSGITFVNGFNEWGDGGAIDSHDTNLTVLNCNFVDNSAGGNGGAIHSHDNNLTVLNCNFVDNSVSMCNGGAIYSHNGTLNVKDSSFVNNSEHTAAIFVYGGEYEVLNSTFINNPNVTFEKFDFNLNVHIDNWEYTIFYPNSAIVIIETDRFDNYDVFINDEFYQTIEITENEYRLIFDNFSPKRYDIRVTFNGDEKYREKNEYTGFEIKMLSPITAIIDNDHITVDEDEIIRVSLPENATGSVTLYLNDEWSDSKEINGEVEFTLSDLSVGTYGARIEYGGDEIYASNSTAVEFKVLELNTIYIFADNISTLENLTVDVYVGGNPTGNVVVSIGSESYTLALVDGHAQTVISGLGVGEYEISATYLNWPEATCTVAVNSPSFSDLQRIIDVLNEGDTLYLTSDVTRQMVYNPDWDEYNPEEQITIRKSIIIEGNGHTIDGAENGRIFYIGDGASTVVFKNVSFINGHEDWEYGGAIYSRSDSLSVINCTFVNNYAGYGGNDIYYEGNLILINTSADFYPKFDCEISVPDCSIVGGDDLIFNVTVTPGATGSIRVEIDWNTFVSEIVDGVARFNISGIYPGDYIINAYYDGDDYYSSCEAYASLHVEEAPVQITVGADDINYGETLVVNVALNKDVSDTATVYIDGSEYEVDLCDGYGGFYINNLLPGTYLVNATYVYDGVLYYNCTEVTVSKAVPEISVTARDVSYGSDVVVKIRGSSEVTGTFTVTVNDVTQTISLDWGEASVRFSGLEIGDYTVVVSYPGDEVYQETTVSSSVSVKDHVYTFSELQGMIDDAEEGSTVYLEYDCVYGDDEYSPININKAITIEGNGHSINGLNSQRIFNIENADVVLNNITFMNGYVDWANGGAIESHNSNLTVLNSNFISNTANDKGSAIYSYCGFLKVENSTFVNNSDNTAAIFVQGGEYEVSNSTFINNPNVTFEKLDINLNVHIDNGENTIFYPNSAIVVIETDRFDNYDVFINDEFYQTVEITENEYRLIFDNFSPKRYDIRVTFNGDEEYNAKDEYTWFEIKMLSPITAIIDKDHITVGEDEIIRVSLPENATGSVTLYLNDEGYDSKEIAGGEVEFNLSGLTADSYNARIDYGGDEIYASNSTSVEFKVFELDTVYIYAEDISTLDDLTIDVYVGGNPTGNVVVSIDSKSYTLALVDGHAQTVISGLAAGEYEIVATYSDVSASSTISVCNATFTDLQNAINNLNEGDTLYLNGNVTCQIIDYGYYYSHEDPVTIDKAITIDGNGHTIDGNGLSRIFNIAADNVVLKNINFINGCSRNDWPYEDPFYGGALYIDGNNTVISGCSFINNIVNSEDTDIMGGAIYTTGNLTVINSIFENNRISDHGGYGYYGGAICSVGNLTIINSTFTSNSLWECNNGRGFGGAVYSDNVVNVYNSTFADNNVDTSLFSYGGAIYASEVNIYNSLFVNNSVKSHPYYSSASAAGGAIKAFTVNVYDSEFINNSAICYTDMSYWSSSNYYVGGGAIDADAASIHGSEFINNNVEGTDIVCLAEGGAIISHGDLNVSDSIFISNKADDGEALWAYAAYASIDNCTFTDNDYTLEILSAGFNLNLNSSIVSVGQSIEISVEFYNHITGTVTIRVNDDERIVQIVNDTAILVLSDLTEGKYDVNVTYVGNEYIEGASKTTQFAVIDGSVITFSELRELINNASAGDTIYLTDYFIADGTGQVVIDKDITIIGNGNIIDGNGQSRIFYIYDANVVLEDISFINAFDSDSGAAIFTESDLTVIDCTFSDNEADWCGAAIDASADLTVINCTFTNNIIHFGDGGAIFAEKNICVVNSCFVNNTHYNPFDGYCVGDALWAYALNASIENCTFINNSYSLKKINTKFDLNINSSLIRVGQSVEISVEFYNDVLGNVTIRVNDDERIVDIVNKSAVLILSDLTEGTYDINVTYYENEYYTYSSGSVKIKVINDSFVTFDELQELIDNATDGDTIYLTKDYISNGNNVYFNKNITIIGNGHIIDYNNNWYSVFIISADNVVFDNLTFINSVSPVIAEDEDSLWEFDYPTMNVTITNCNFEDNDGSAYLLGSVIAFTHTNVTVINSTFSNNKGFYGIIYDSSAVIVIVNCSFVNNINIGYYDHNVCTIYGKDITVTDSIFEDNTIENIDGSIVQVYDIYAKESLFVKDSTFINNSTDMDDYIYLENGNKTVIGCEFINKYDKNNTDIIITADNIIAGQDLIVDVYLSENATGNVTLTIGSESYTQSLTDAHAQFVVSGLTAGSYDLIVDYAGDDNFNKAQNISQVIVKGIPTININAQDINYGEDLIIDVSVNSAATGNITITVNGKDYNMELNEGKAILNISNLAANTYLISVNYGGDENFESASANASAKVNKKDTSIAVTASDVTYGNDLVIDVALSEAVDGVATVTVDGKEYVVNLIDGMGQVNVSGLAGDSYVVSASYAGNQNLSSASATKSVSVNKKSVSLSVVANDVVYGSDLAVSVALSEAVNDKVIVSVGGKDYTVNLVGGKGQLTVSGLAGGSYVVSASFAGNQNLSSDSAKKSVNVNKANSTISVNAKDILIGEVANINIIMGEDETGQLKVTLSDDKGVISTTTLNIASKNILLPISDLKAGEYDVLVSYAGDNNYLGTSSSDSFKVSKRNPKIILDAPNIKEGKDAVITVNIANATGSVVVKVNGNENTLSLVNNKAVLTLSGLAIGSYDVSVSYAGNDILLAGVNTTTFEVEYYKYTYKDLQALIDGASTGKTINLERDYAYDQSVDNNVITINKAITINGNGHVVDALGKAGIFKITGNNVVLDDLVLINANAVKGAAVFIAGSDVTVQNTILENNTAESGAGIYSEGLKTSIIGSTFTNNVANVGAGAVLYGDDATIFKSNFTSNEANLGAGAVSYGLRTNCTESIFKNNSVVIEDLLSSSDLLKLSLDDLLKAQTNNGIGAGLVLYGDDAIVSDSQFIGNDAKEGAGLVVGANNCIVSGSVFEDNTADSGAGVVITGENASVLYSTFTNNNAEEGAGLVINGTNTTVSESEFNKNSAKEGAGILVQAKNTTVTNSSFEQNTAEIGTAILVEEEASLIIEENDVSDKPLTVAYISSLEIIVDSVEVNEDVTIKVVVKSASIYPISGTVTIKFANEEYKVKVENNSAIKVISGLPAGVYDVSAKYSGDVNHTSSSAAGNFTVSKISNVNITSEIDGAYSGERSNITFNLPEDATGTVTATVNGKKYNAPVTNGSATITLDKLPVGDYKVDMQYSGDDKYASVKYTTDIAIESSIVINAPDLVKYYKGPERFVVTVTDYKGNVISGENVTINLNGKDYIRTTDDKGVASMAINLNSGKYNVTVKYGDCSVNSTITVKSTVSGQNVTKMFRNGTQYYATFIDTNGNTLANNTEVEFNINGVFYKRYTNEKGVARMNINLNPGEYIITAKNPKSGEMYTNIITVLSTIVENNDLTKYYKNASQYSLKLLDAQGNPVGAGVEVKLNINGVFYTRSSNASGYVNMNINLVPGTYTITAEYNGLRASNTIKVLPVIETKDLSMKYKDGSKFEAKILDGQGKPYAGQEVTFNINGVFYKRTTGEDGIARLSINLLAGKYIITTMYNGLNAANKVTISS